MNDVDRLKRWFDDGTLVRPCTAVPDTVDLARALASLMRVRDVDVTPAALRISEAIGASDHYVLVLVDGLGMNLLDRQQSESFFRKNLAMEMQAVCTSSTAPALTSIATLEWPAQHGVTGWFVYLPEWELTGTVLPYVERFSKRPLTQFGVDSRIAFPSASRLSAGTYEARCYLPKHIAGSIYSEYFAGGAATIGYDSLAGACTAIARRIEQATVPTYTYLYVPFVDQAEHTHGPYADPVRQITSDVERTIERLVLELRGRGRVIVTADHGQIHLERERQHELRPSDPLLEMLIVPPSCEARVLALHVRQGQHERFAELFRERFGATFALLTIDEADDLRLFGPSPLGDVARVRLGDFVAITGGADGILHRRDGPMIGFHGGLSPEEMRIPLIVV